MASDLDFTEYVVDQMADAGRVFIGDVVEAPAYPGARLSFLIEDRLEDKDWISRLIKLTEKELPLPKPGKKRKAHAPKKT